jgi:hypothetical protein
LLVESLVVCWAVQKGAKMVAWWAALTVAR